MRLTDRFAVAAPPDRVWAAFQQPEDLAAAVPGVEAVEMLDSARFRARMTIKLPFMTLSFAVQGALTPDPDGRRMAVELTGQPAAFAGAFRARLALELHEAAGQGTEVAYEMDLQLAGRLASLGEPLIRSTAGKLGQAFAHNLQARFAA